MRQPQDFIFLRLLRLFAANPRSKLLTAYRFSPTAKTYHPPLRVRCRTASNSVMIVAIATLSESAWPAMGIRTCASLSFSQYSLSPYCSLPITIASGPRRSASV